MLPRGQGQAIWDVDFRPGAAVVSSRPDLLPTKSRKMFSRPIDHSNDFNQSVTKMSIISHHVPIKSHENVNIDAINIMFNLLFVILHHYCELGVDLICQTGRQNAKCLLLN